MGLIQSHYALTRRGSQDTSTLRTAVEDLKRKHHQQTQQRGVRRGWEGQRHHALSLTNQLSDSEVALSLGHFVMAA